MNGLEILSERVVNPPIVMPILVSILLIGLAIVCLVVALSGDAEELTIVFVLFCALSVSGAIGIIFDVGNDKPYIIYKVSPTQEEYYIDLDKYEILNKEGKIIELKEK